MAVPQILLRVAVLYDKVGGRRSISTHTESHTQTLLHNHTCSPSPSHISSHTLMHIFSSPYLILTIPFPNLDDNLISP